MKNFIQQNFNRERWIYTLPYFVLILVIIFIVAVITVFASSLCAKEDRIFLYPNKGLTVSIMKQIRGKEAGDLLRPYSEFNQVTVKDGDFVIYQIVLKNASDQTVSFYNPRVFSNNIRYNSWNFTPKKSLSLFPIFRIDYKLTFLETRPFNIENMVIGGYPTLPETGKWQRLFPEGCIIDLKSGGTRIGCIVFDKDIDNDPDKDFTKRTKNTIIIENTLYLPFTDKPVQDVK